MPTIKRISYSKYLKCVDPGCIHKRTLVFDLHKHWDDHGPKVHLLDEKPSQTVELTKEKGLELYKQMHLIRRVENTCADLYRKKQMRGFCHLYIGQEAIAVGIHSVLRPDDTIITSYRCHAWVVLRSENVVGLLSELLGYSSGFSRGKGGSMHIYAKNFFGGNGIVGAQAPLGVGLALKHKYTGSDAVSVTALGDGAFPQGQVSESFNFAKLYHLPVLFLIENNHYGMGTSSNRSSAFDEYYRFSPCIPGIRANGMDILSVMEATKFAVQHIRDGKGPIVLEMMTYRYHGHSMSDPGTSYRSKEEVETVRKERDCIKHLGTLLTESHLATTEELTAIEQDNKTEVEAALAEARKGKPPSSEELYTDVYAEYHNKIRLSSMLTEVPYKTLSKFNKQRV